MQNKQMPRAGLIIGAIVVVLILGGGIYWYTIQQKQLPTITQQLPKSKVETTPVQKIDAVKVETVQAQSPLYGIVDATTADTIALKELRTPMPGEKSDGSATTGKTYTLKATDKTTITTFSKQKDGSLQDKPAKFKDIKKGDYILTSALDTTLPQPIMITNLRFGNENPL